MGSKRTVRVATLGALDDGGIGRIRVEAAGDITLASTSDNGVKGNDYNSSSSLRRRRWVAFLSVATNLDPADTDGFDDIYVKDLVTGDITLGLHL